MTLTQLEYILSVEKYGHFAKAADACNVTQPTLSATIQKLEEELDTKIFDRGTHPIVATKAGRKVLDQARVILYNALQLKEIVLSEREQENGTIRVGIIPTIAPYIVPKLFSIIKRKYPNIQLQIMEARTAALVPALKRAEVDIAILATHHLEENLLEIPIYKESMVAYLSKSHHLYNNESILVKELNADDLWVLQEEHCFSDQVLSLCKLKSEFSPIYRAGSIDTLIKIVDENGGYTIIPQLHVQFLSEDQQCQIKPITNPVPMRDISLYIRNDYVRERLLNIIAKVISQIVPKEMLEKSIVGKDIKI
jgi:LysR family hydrogen peroxide-inducible transcriptional activator